MKLTVIIRDISPFIHFQDAPRHRSVTIELTQEQEALLGVGPCGYAQGATIYEEIAQCFIEPIEPADAKIT